jgi:hypothetical protein
MVSKWTPQNKIYILVGHMETKRFNTSTQLADHRLPKYSKLPAEEDCSHALLKDLDNVNTDQNEFG